MLSLVYKHKSISADDSTLKTEGIIMARPTLLNKDSILKAREYLGSNKNAKGILTIEGLALELEVSRDTIYEWESRAQTAESEPTNQKKDEQQDQEMLELFVEFSDILTRVRLNQAEKLIQSGLNGTYNPVITKLMLSKHGYIEKKETDLTSGGEKLKGALVEFVGDDGTPPENQS